MISKEQEDMLKAYFHPDLVEARVGRSSGDNSAEVVFYLDSQTVMDRLDQVLGPGNWSFDWSPVTVNGNDVMTAKGTLTIGGVPKSDIGEAGNFEKSKGAVRDALKRCADMWGVGRYLRDLGLGRVTAKTIKGPGGIAIAPTEMKRLRDMLPRPGQLRATIEQVAILCAWYGETFREKFSQWTVDQAHDAIIQATPKRKAGAA